MTNIHSRGLRVLSMYASISERFQRSFPTILKGLGKSGCFIHLCTDCLVTPNNSVISFIDIISSIFSILKSSVTNCFNITNIVAIVNTKWIAVTIIKKISKTALTASIAM